MYLKSDTSMGNEGTGNRIGGRRNVNVMKDVRSYKALHQLKNQEDNESGKNLTYLLCHIYPGVSHQCAPLFSFQGVLKESLGMEAKVVRPVRACDAKRGALCRNL